MPDIVGKKFFYFLISTLIILPGLVSLFLWRLNLGIDFTGGTLLEFKIEKNVNVQDVKNFLANQNVEVSTLQESGSNTYLLRTKPIDKDKNEAIKKSLSEKFGQVEELRFETVGPTVGAELMQKAVMAIVIASFAIVFYIAWAFRQLPKPASSWRFGICAIVALIHDVLVVVGIFSILGHFLHVEIDALFVTALLTVIGFSVHDTIVVFDRIRENLKKEFGKTFTQIVNESILQTLGRSLNTSITVVLVLLALFLLGGQSLKWFVLALLVGIISGTYSSIFNASPLLVLWQERSQRK